jgi:hypothetical protein
MKLTKKWLALVAWTAWAGCGGTDGSAGSVRSAGGSGGDGGGEDGKVLVCPCKVTGGGFVFVDDTKVTFGFNAQPASKNPDLVDDAFAAKGQFEINFHDDEKAKEHGDVETIACFPQEDETVLVRFGGTLKDDGAFTVEVVDRGEPGVNDTISFTGGGESFPTLDLGGAGPGGGNIQLHKIDLSKCVEVEKPPPVCPK